MFPAHPITTGSTSVQAELYTHVDVTINSVFLLYIFFCKSHMDYITNYNVYQKLKLIYWFQPTPPTMFTLNPAKLLTLATRSAHCSLATCYSTKDMLLGNRGRVAIRRRVDSSVEPCVLGHLNSSLPSHDMGLVKDHCPCDVWGDKTGERGPGTPSICAWIMWSSILKPRHFDWGFVWIGLRCSFTIKKIEDLPYLNSIVRNKVHLSILK